MALTADQLAAGFTAAGIDDEAKLGAFLAGVTSLTQTVAAVGIPADRLTRLLKSGDITTRQADLKAQIAKLQAQRQAAIQATEAQVQSLQSQINTLDQQLQAEQAAGA